MDNYMTLEKYLKPEDCIHGKIYRGQGRNYNLGLCSLEKDGKVFFHGLREKWGTEYIDWEIHFDQDESHGTFKPVEPVFDFSVPNKQYSLRLDILEIKLKELSGRKITAEEMVVCERFRQSAIEGYDKEHDLQHQPDEFAIAAAAYALNPKNLSEDARNFLFGETGGRGLTVPWPWTPETDKRDKHDKKRSYTIAAALMVAALQRLLEEETE